MRRGSRPPSAEYVSCFEDAFANVLNPEIRRPLGILMRNNQTVPRWGKWSSPCESRNAGRKIDCGGTKGGAVHHIEPRPSILIYVVSEPVALR